MNGEQRTGDPVADVVCDCAATPPNMPTYRKHHLPTCPCWVVENAGNMQHRITEPIALRTSNLRSIAIPGKHTGEAHDWQERCRTENTNCRRFYDADEADAEIERLERLVYVPGLWRCAKCGCEAICTEIHAQSGRMRADKSSQTCPNNCGPMWRVTERDAGNRLVERLERLTSDRLLAVVERAASHACVRPLIDCRPGARCLPCMAREALGRQASENPLPHGASL